MHVCVWGGGGGGGSTKRGGGNLIEKLRYKCTQILLWIIVTIITLQTYLTNSKAGLFKGKCDPGRTGNSQLGSSRECLSPDNVCWIFWVMLTIQNKKTTVILVILTQLYKSNINGGIIFNVFSRKQLLGQVSFNSFLGKRNKAWSRRRISHFLTKVKKRKVVS